MMRVVRYLLSKFMVAALAAATLATVIAGALGWREVLPAHGAEASLSQVAYLTLRAFVFGDEYSGFGGTALDAAVQDSILLQTARWAGAVTAFGALIRAGAELFRIPLRRFRAALQFNHTVVIGDAPVAGQIAERSVGFFGVAHHTSDDGDRWDGVLRLPRSPEDKAQLARQSLRGAERIIVAEDSEADTAHVALSAARSQRGTKVFAVLRDPWLAEHIGHTVEAADDGDQTEPHNLIAVSEHAASVRALVVRHPPHLIARRSGQSQIHLVIFGFGDLGESIVRDVVHTCTATELGALKVTVLDVEAAAREAAFEARYPGLVKAGDILDIRFIAGDARNMTAHVCAALASRCQETAATAHYIATPDDGRSLATALLVQETMRRTRLSHAPIFLRARRGGGLEERAGGSAFNGASEIVGFGAWSEVIDASGVLDAKPDALASNHHDRYRSRSSGGEADAEWNRLRERYRNSNRRAVAHTPAKLFSLGFDITPLAQGSASPSARPALAQGQRVFRNAAELMKIAELEHTRWMADRLVDGWRPTEPGEARDNQARKHPNLIPFDQLSFETQAYDIRLAAKLVDWVVRRPDGMRRPPHAPAAPPETDAAREAVRKAGVENALGV